MPDSSNAQAASMTAERPPAAAAPEPETERPTEEPPGPGWLHRFAGSTATIAIVSWLVALPLAFLIPRALDLDPFSEQGAFIPLAFGGLLLVGLTTLAFWRKADEWVPAVSAGLLAAWVALMFRAYLNGSPFSTTGLVGDRVRVSAAATRYTEVFWSSDHFIEGIPAEYPPLYPWLTGKAAVILHVPAWRLLGFVDVGVVSLAVVVGFLMWRRLVSAALALPLSAVGLLIYGDPRKAFAVITLFVFIPWVISSFAEPPRGRLHWLPAGVIGGLIMLTYNGWFPFAGFGVLAIAVAVWRRSTERARYVKHVVLTGAVLLIVSAPYLVPYFYTSLTKGGQAVSDLWIPDEVANNGFPFLKTTLIAGLELIGLIGLLWYRRRHWWSWTLLYLVLGSYAWWLLLGVRFVFTGHTTLFYYAWITTSVTLLIAAVLSLATAGPALARRLQVTPPYRIGAAAMALLMVWLGFTYTQEWRPYPRLGVSAHNDYTTWAHLEPRPDCTYDKYAPRDGRIPCLPVDKIKAEVERVKGASVRPDTLAADERLYAYLPWRGYMGMDRTSGNTLAHWDERHAEVTRLAGISDPTAFAKASSSTKFGPINVFVLTRTGSQSYAVLDQTFTAGQFDPSVWEVTELSPQPVVVITRR